ncbi:DNA gyrase, A subunit [Rubidibacter lacunae KORDI 51-2]|uniref:DNA gyrase subunit A n=1 Tax=Rubidibacter lacunae KORDI 51-2 TaxID=582515 RepID=U5DLH0_9CHRO|nr:DNA gyrase subunit A [Rubidibacter lacunae]ERN40560.1 DNA gyrase, A subunit [Rubidibacter lacunae KORDI 51-2]
MTFSNSPERIVPTELRTEMSQSYLEYAMSVIVGRALPDARDGLKPVHRRILYAMYELGLMADRPFRKCARVVGEVLGKYHPHGETSIYDALVRMAQDFSMRELLIDGHGNFGSVDDDPPAAMRYTECRLRAISSDSLLQDIESETVDFADNFDGSQQEPTVLPSRLPQLLLNGSSGIAVGMATNIPPHNLGELVDGTIALVRNADLSDRELIQIVPGPDFPTGGTILGRAGIADAYSTGRGSITMRGVATIETLEQRGRPDREAIVITELPYQTNKAALIEKIADLANEKRIDGIADLRDESDRDGMRVVIELKRDAYPRVVLNNLYKQTPLQANFGANMLALVDGEPQILGLKAFLQVFINFRVETIGRRTQYLLRKAEERDHILQGLLVALNDIEAVIRIVRAAADTPSAKAGLIERFELSEAQVDAILQMQLRRLTALEADKILAEHEELLVRITDYRDILARRERVDDIIVSELEQLKERFATPRRTVIEAADGELVDLDLIANEQAIVLLTEQGYIKRMPVSTFDAQNRATRGKSAARIKEDDGIDLFISCCDHDRVLFFSDRGVVYSLCAYQIPAGSRTARGSAIVQMLPISREERITSIVPVTEFSEDEYLVMLTRNGYVKKTPLSAFSNIRSNGLIAISLGDGDELRWVRLARNSDSLIVGSRAGMAIHFRTDRRQLRPLGRATRGVRAMKLRGGDELISMDILPAQVTDRLGMAGFDSELDDDAEAVGELEAIEPGDLDDSDDLAAGETEANAGPWLLAITTGGYGKRVPVTQFRLQNRAGKGVTVMKFRGKDCLAALTIVNSGDELMLVTNRGIIIRQVIDAISQQSRLATGVRVQRLDEDDAIAAVAVVPPPADEEDALEVEADALEAGEDAVENADGDSATNGPEAAITDGAEDALPTPGESITAELDRSSEEE